MAVRVLSTLWLVLATAAIARAEMAVDFNRGVMGYLGYPPITAGWSFTLEQGIIIEDLGFFDQEPPGLLQDHPIGLWSIDGSVLLAEATVTNGSRLVPSASADDPDWLIGQAHGNWLFEAIPSLSLGPGTYVIGAFYPEGDCSPGRFCLDQLCPFTEDAAMHSYVLFENMLYGILGRFEPPLYLDPEDAGRSGYFGYFGPNFCFSVIPEPSTALLLLSLLCALVWAEFLNEIRRVGVG